MFLVIQIIGAIINIKNIQICTSVFTGKIHDAKFSLLEMVDNHILWLSLDHFLPPAGSKRVKIIFLSLLTVAKSGRLILLTLFEMIEEVVPLLVEYAAPLVESLFTGISRTNLIIFSLNVRSHTQYIIGLMAT